MIIIKLNDYDVVINNNQCNINGSIVVLSDEDIIALNRIIRSIHSSNVSEEYVIVDDNTLYFKNPKSYSYIELKEFLGGLYDRC